MNILANLKDLTSKSNYKKISLNFFLLFFWFLLVKLDVMTMLFDDLIFILVIGTNKCLKKWVERGHFGRFGLFSTIGAYQIWSQNLWSTRCRPNLPKMDSQYIDQTTKKIWTRTELIWNHKPIFHKVLVNFKNAILIFNFKYGANKT